MYNWQDNIKSQDPNNFELGLIWSKENSLQQIANIICNEIKNIEFEFLACIETKGIIFGAAVSAINGKELIIFKKINKIHYTSDKYVRKYTNWRKKKDGVEIEKDEIKKDSRIIVIDDIVDTAVTFENITSIINEANAKVVKYICIKNLSKILEINGIKIKSLL